MAESGLEVDPKVAEVISSRLMRRDAPYSVTDRSIRTCLQRRSTPWDYEIHFSVFILLKDEEFVQRNQLNVDHITEILEDYILTSRHDSVAGSELMLSTLLVEDWPIDHARRLVDLTMKQCRYRFRVEGLRRAIDFYWDSLPEARKKAFERYRQ